MTGARSIKRTRETAGTSFEMTEAVARSNGNLKRRKGRLTPYAIAKSGENSKPIRSYLISDLCSMDTSNLLLRGAHTSPQYFQCLRVAMLRLFRQGNA